MNKVTTEWENVKLPRLVGNKVRQHKKKTGVSIMAFTKNAILEKLERESQFKTSLQRIKLQTL